MTHNHSTLLVLRRCSRLARDRLQEGGAGTETGRAGAGAPAIKGSIRVIVTADAVLYPRDQANIVPKISAPVRRFLVNRGDHVKQGQLLAELENRDLVARRQREPRPVRAGASRTAARRPASACRSR